MHTIHVYIYIDSSALNAFCVRYFDNKHTRRDPSRLPSRRIARETRNARELPLDTIRQNLS